MCDFTTGGEMKEIKDMKDTANMSQIWDSEWPETSATLSVALSGGFTSTKVFAKPCLLVLKYKF